MLELPRFAYRGGRPGWLTRATSSLSDGVGDVACGVVRAHLIHFSRLTATHPRLPTGAPSAARRLSYGPAESIHATLLQISQ